MEIQQEMGKILSKKVINMDISRNILNTTQRKKNTPEFNISELFNPRKCPNNLKLNLLKEMREEIEKEIGDKLRGEINFPLGIKKGKGIIQNNFTPTFSLIAGNQIPFMNLGALIPEAFKFPGNLSISEIYFSLSVAYFINFGQVFQYVEKYYESTYAMKEEYYKIKDIYYEYEDNVVRLYKELENSTSIEKQILDISQKGNQQEIVTNE